MLMLQQYIYYLSCAEYFTENTVRPKMFQLNPNGHFVQKKDMTLAHRKKGQNSVFNT